MGVDLIVRGADFSVNALGYDPPVTRGLRYWGFFNNGGLTDATAQKARLAKNWAPGGVDGGVIGSPVIGANFTRFKGGTDYLDTGLNESAAMTVFAVVRSDATFADAANRPYLMGSDGWGVYVGATTGVPQVTLSNLNKLDNGAGGSAFTVGSLAITDFSVWQFLAFIREPGVGTRTYQPATKVITPRVETRAPVVATMIKNRFGTGGRADYLGEVEKVMAADYNVVLTTAEIDAIYVAAKAFCASRGIAI